MIPPWQLDPEGPAPKPSYIALVTDSENPLPDPEPGSPLDYALKYAALGWYVFPIWGALDGKCRCANPFCKSPGKHPISSLVTNGHSDATLDQATIRRWWSAMTWAGIGINLYKSGLMAVDQDPRNGSIWTMEILNIQHGELASDVVAWTQGGGIHQVFKLPDVNISLPGKLGNGVDVKLNGYIAVEPTIGPLGAYSWDEESNPLKGALPSPLPDWIRNLSSSPVPLEMASVASRHATPGQLAELQDALSYLPADDRDQFIRFGLALKPLGAEGWKLWTDWAKKSVKYTDQYSHKTWLSFKPVGAVNFESIFYAANQAGWINPLAGQGDPLPQPVPVESVRIIEPKIILPSPAFKIPGVLGDVEDWINTTSRKNQPMFATQSALSFGATVLGRRYVTAQRNWPSLYFLNIGKSASGKEHGKWAVETLLEACNMDRLIGPSFYTSDAGVLSALLAKPSHITIIDEFGKIIEASRVKNSPRSASAMTKLIESFSKCDGSLRPPGYSSFGLSQSDMDKMNNKIVKNPALTILAMTTPDSFYDTVSSASVRDGFLNRFLIVESNIGRQVGEHVAPTPVTDGVIQWATTCHSHQGYINPDIVADQPANPTVIQFTRGALKVFANFDAECIGLMDDHERHGLDEMFGRSNEIAMRLSLIVALSCEAPVIEQEHAEWATEYVRHHAMNTVERMKLAIADSDFEAACNQVLSLIRSHRHGLTQAEIGRFSRRYRALDQRGRMNILNTLKFAGDIELVTIPPRSGRGKAREAYVAIKDDDASDG